MPRKPALNLFYSVRHKEHEKITAVHDVPPNTHHSKIAPPASHPPPTACTTSRHAGYVTTLCESSTLRNVETGREITGPKQEAQLNSDIGSGRLQKANGLLSLLAPSATSSRGCVHPLFRDRVRPTLSSKMNNQGNIYASVESRPVSTEYGLHLPAKSTGKCLRCSRISPRFFSLQNACSGTKPPPITSYTNPV